jgi:hypothetical protein
MEGGCLGAEKWSASEISRRDGRASMKHQIINADLWTDLEVTAIALSAVAVFAMIAFMFNFVIAPI